MDVQEFLERCSFDERQEINKLAIDIALLTAIEHVNSVANLQKELAHGLP